MGMCWLLVNMSKGSHERLKPMHGHNGECGLHAELQSLVTNGHQKIELWKESAKGLLCVVLNHVYRHNLFLFTLRSVCR